MTAARSTAGAAPTSLEDPAADGLHQVMTMPSAGPGGGAMPTVGRIVLYTLPEHEAAPTGVRTVPAVVSGILERATGDLVNLRIFRDGPPAGDEWRPSVPRASDPGEPGTWAWPRRAPEG